MDAEQIEQQYYAASDRVGEFIKQHTPEQVRNLLEQYLVGVFDVGVTESLTPEQVQGVTLWLDDLLETAKHLDLSKGAEPGEFVSWR